MTQPVQMERPTGEAAKHYAEANRLEREAAEAVQDWNLEEAERLRGLAKVEWEKFKELSR